MVEKLIQCYYESFGTFDGINSSSISSLLRPNDDNLIEYCYKCLGFYSDNDLSSIDRATIRKMIAKNQKNDAKSYLSKLNKSYTSLTDEALLKLAKKLGCMPSITRLSKNKSKYLNEVLALSSYLINNEEIYLNTTDGTEYLKSQLFGLKNASNLADLDKMTDYYASVLSQALEVYVAEDLGESKVVCGVLYVKQEVSLETILRESLKEIGGKLYTLGFSVNRFVVGNAVNYQINSHYFPDIYHKILDISNICGCTVKELFDLCDLNFVNEINIWEDAGCLVYILNANSLALLDPKSESFQCVQVSIDYFKQLYELNCLNSLHFENNVAYVIVNGNRIKVKEG